MHHGKILRLPWVVLKGPFNYFTSGKFPIRSTPCIHKGPQSTLPVLSSLTEATQCNLYTSSCSSLPTSMWVWQKQKIQLSPSGLLLPQKPEKLSKKTKTNKKLSVILINYFIFTKGKLLIPGGFLLGAKKIDKGYHNCFSIKIFSVSAAPNTLED